MIVLAIAIVVAVLVVGSTIKRGNKYPTSSRSDNAVLRMRQEEDQQAMQLNRSLNQR